MHQIDARYRAGLRRAADASARASNDPIACLRILVIILCLAWISAALRYDFKVMYTLDSFDYSALSETRLTLNEVFSARRPPAYPALLTIVRAFGKSYQALPYFQYTIFFAAILALYRCCRLSGFKGWEALLLSAPLVNSSVLREYGGYMMTEAPSTALAIVAIGLSLLIAAKGPAQTRNSLLAVCILVACLIRPGLVFLAAFCPVAILIITPSLRRGLNRRQLMRELLPNVAFASIPLLLYAAIRLATVGDFGIVSYGGVSLAGLGTNPVLLTSAEIPKLPPDLRGLARAIIDKRAAVASQPPARIPAFVYDEGEMRQRPMLESFTMSTDPSIWTVAVPAARSYYGASHRGNLNPDWVLINNKLGSLSFAVLRLNFREYLKWIVSAVRSSVQNVFHHETAGRWEVGACVSLIILFLAMGALRTTVGFVAQNRLGTKETWAILGGGVAMMLLFNAEAVGSLARTSIGAVKGTIVGTLYPLTIIFACLLATFAATWRSLRNQSDLDRNLYPTMAYATLTALFFFAGLLVVVLFNVPQKRYLIGLSPLMPGALVLLSVKLLHRVGSGVVRIN